MSDQIKVLVVDDSAFMRRVITDMLQSSPLITVVGTARNGQDGLEKAHRLRPDLITLDIEMPVLDGLSVLPKLLNELNCPVIMLSSHTREGAQATLDALELGAMDFVPKPAQDLVWDITKIRDDLVSKVISAMKAHLPLRRIVVPERPIISPKAAQGIAGRAVDGPVRCLVAIGASTGGPQALQTVLTGLDSAIPASFLVVQHMPPRFTKSLAQRLDSLCQLTVDEAEDGDIIREGRVLIAKADWQMTVVSEGGVLKTRLLQTPPISGHRPSVNALFTSLPAANPARVIAVVLTGMGNDGSAGVVAVKEAGATVLAEDASTAVINGMPKAAVQTGCVDYVVPLHEISGLITRLVMGG
ncbi:MAG: protein-glutamate methylesterase/protein-glutamine glutaminase [Bacillota bacterium]